ncbi:ABC transporter ATP-binding protein [Actinopolymorpha sp. B11F2]|uniref:ABC transporter ATP-binding protein n=1 Tax=Actinopolymorpha sp. B11F2 TaxID=3160862 RepID=UPI0032E3B751
MSEATISTPDTEMSTDSVVSVRNVHVEFPTPVGVVNALNGVSFDVPRGKVLGIVGESGCGKSVTARAILRIIEKPGRIVSGDILFRPRRRRSGGSRPSPAAGASGQVDNDADSSEIVDLTSLDPGSPEIRSIRGQEISMIFQEPMTSLNPVYTIGNQIEEAVLLHQTSDRSEAQKKAVEILRRVGMPNPDRIAQSYPHQLSGGMRQRAMIAMALSCTPTLLIADEPTTALDVTTEAQILELMRELQESFGMSIMFITHSMGVVAQLCDEVVVMYLGRVVERAPVDDLFHDPKHPYTVSLLRSIPRIGVNRGAQLEVIKGSVPDPYSKVPGCPFHPRCPSAMPGLCDTVLPEETAIADKTDHSVRCHLYPGSTPAEVASATTAK